MPTITCTSRSTSSVVSTNNLRNRRARGECTRIEFVRKEILVAFSDRLHYSISAVIQLLDFLMQVQGEEGKKQLTYGLARLANMTPFVLILTDDNWNVLVSVIDMRTEFAATTPLPRLSLPNAKGFSSQTFYG